MWQAPNQQTNAFPAARSILDTRKVVAATTIVLLLHTKELGKADFNLCLNAINAIV
jgi:hypothetical protein